MSILNRKKLRGLLSSMSERSDASRYNLATACAELIYKPELTPYKIVPIYWPHDTADNNQLYIKLNSYSTMTAALNVGLRDWDGDRTPDFLAVLHVPRVTSGDKMPSTAWAVRSDGTEFQISTGGMTDYMKTIEQFYDPIAGNYDDAGIYYDTDVRLSHRSVVHDGCTRLVFGCIILEMDDPELSGDLLYLRDLEKVFPDEMRYVREFAPKR